MDDDLNIDKKYLSIKKGAMIMGTNIMPIPKRLPIRVPS